MDAFAVALDTLASATPTPVFYMRQVLESNANASDEAAAAGAKWMSPCVALA